MNLLLINPPIYDFAAYSLWAKPVGLLKIASMLKFNNIPFYYFDFLDISQLNEKELKAEKIKIKKSGRHTYPKQMVKKPEKFDFINRHFYRFGLNKSYFLDFIKHIKSPDYVIITSIMTYWYLGINEVIEYIRNFFPKAKIILGGIYANLCKEHALKLDIDFVANSIDDIIKLLNLENVKRNFFPLYLNIYKKNYFAPIYTSFGCPYSCVYCANKFLNRRYFQRDINEVVEEIQHYYSLGIKNFAFYDDALLINKNRHFIPLFEKIVQLNLDINFFCPNGLHISEINEKVANLMQKAGFKDLRLSLETANEVLQKRLGYKTDNSSFINAVEVLKKAGFNRDNISVYLLVGLPHQQVKDIYQSIEFAKQFDIKVKLAEYSPIPHTKLWEESKQVTKYDIENEPLFHNNKILPVADENLTIDTLNEMKRFAHQN